MGALRTINHPGIEIQEYDRSGYASTVGGTTSLVIGFAPQGQSIVPVQPTSTASEKAYFGAPETEAERYFYYACKEVFDKGGNLIAARIPYNNNSQYLTPAVKYNINEWTTTHNEIYTPYYSNKKVGKFDKNLINEYGAVEVNTYETVTDFTVTSAGIEESYNVASTLNNPRLDKDHVGFIKVTTQFNDAEKQDLITDVVSVGADEIGTTLLSSNQFFAISSVSYTANVYNENASYQSGDVVYHNNMNYERNAKINFSSVVDNNAWTIKSDVDDNIAFKMKAGEEKWYNGKLYELDELVQTAVPSSNTEDWTEVGPISEARSIKEDGEYTIGNIISVTYAASGTNTLETAYYVATVNGASYNDLVISTGTSGDNTLNENPTEWNLISRFDADSYTKYAVNEVTIYNSRSDSSQDAFYKRAEEILITPSLNLAINSTDKTGLYTVSEFNSDTTYAINDEVKITDESDVTVYIRTGTEVIDGQFNSKNWTVFIPETIVLFSVDGMTGDEKKQSAQYLKNLLRYGVNQTNDVYAVIAKYIENVNNLIGVSEIGQNNIPVYNITEFRTSTNNVSVSHSESDADNVFTLEKNTGDNQFTVKVISFSDDITENLKGESNIDLTDDNWNAGLFRLFTIEKNVIDLYDDKFRDDTSSFIYNKVRKQPTLTKLTARDGNTYSIINSYYDEELGTATYVDTDEEHFLAVVDKDGKPLEDATTMTSGSEFMVIEKTFSATKDEAASFTSINENIKPVPVRFEIPVEGYNDNIVTSEALTINALEEGKKWTDVEENYPTIEGEDVFGTGNPIYVLKSIKTSNGGTSTNVYEEGQYFYQFVSKYNSIKTIAEKGLPRSEYTWIKWTYNYGNKSYNDKKDSILLSTILGCNDKDVPAELSNIEHVVEITKSPDDTGFIPLSSYQDMRDGIATPTQNSIVIANITEARFSKDMYNNDGEEVIGIVPVMVTGFQALPAQSRIELGDTMTNEHIFNAIEGIIRGKSIDGVPEEVVINRVELKSDGFVKSLGDTEEYNPFANTYSADITSMAKKIGINANLKPIGSDVNTVTLVVCQLAVSKANDNKISMTILESFSGSIDKNAKDESGNSTYIQTIVNSEETGSSYVRMFVNYDTALTEDVDTWTSKTDDFGVTTFTHVSKFAKTNETTATLVSPRTITESNWWTKTNDCMSIGFTEEQTKKYIAYSTITASLEAIFDFLSNVDETEIDLVVDAGLSTIANYIKLRTDEDQNGNYKFEYDIEQWDQIKDVNSVAAWKSICAKLLTFCSSTRKDCMAVVDAPRSLCVRGSKKLVLPAGKYSVDYDILPKFNFLAGLNSSYGAGYCDWLSYVDDFSGKTVWLPPSIAAEGAMIYTDYNANYWDAPAGTNRAIVTSAIEVAFNPNSRQQDSIYPKAWNYAISTTADGIVIWGQRTLQTATSAFDRINVRRLFLRLERMTRKALKAFLFEINNEKTRNRVVDRLTPIFENVKTMGGLYDYQLIVDERNNTPSVIDNNELRVAVKLKPSKVAEYIICSFFALSTGMDFSEVDNEL